MRPALVLTCLARVFGILPDDHRDERLIVWDFLMGDAVSEDALGYPLVRMEVSIRGCTKALPTPAICMSLYDSVHRVASMIEMDRDEELFESQRLHRSLTAWGLVPYIFSRRRSRYEPEKEDAIRSEICERLLDITGPRVWDPTEWKMWHDAVMVIKDRPIDPISGETTSSVAAIGGMLIWEAICGLNATWPGGHTIEYIRRQARRMKQLTAAGRIPGEFIRRQSRLYLGATIWGWTNDNMFWSCPIIGSGLDELEKLFGQ